MAERNVRPAAIVLVTFFGILLCIVTAAGGYWFGRQSGAQQVAESEEPVVVTVEVTPDHDLVDEAVATAPTIPEVEPDEETTVPHEEAAADPAISDDGNEVAQDEPEEDVAQGELPFNTARESDFSDEDLDLLWEVWQLVEEEFDGELPDDETLRYAAIRGVLDALGDEYTRFTPPEAAALVRERMSGTFEGIGAWVQENDDGLTEIVRPMDGQPADRAGLQAGDVVIGVDGESMIGRTMDEVIALIRGPEGTEVTLTIRREGLEEPFDVTVMRARVEIPVIESEMIEENVAYVRLSSFNRNAETQLTEALVELLAQQPEGLILDLRDNPGGFLDQAVAVADLFLAENVIVYERSITLDIDQEFRADTGDLAEEIPLVVLVNAGSASASEIVAGAIRDHGRAILIGETTFGKGSVQYTNVLSDGSELRVTIARWYIPSEQSIDGTGIEPDIEVETPEDLGGEEDPQLERAIEFVLSGE